MSVFAGHAQVVYYDHRGHGRSDIGHPEDWTLVQWGADLAGLLDALEIERSYVLGASFGGFVAQSFAAQFPDRVAKLALVSTAARSDTALSTAMFAQLGGPEVGEVARAWLDQDEAADQEEFVRRCLPYYTVGDIDLEALGRSVERPYLRDHFFGRGGEWHTSDLTDALQRLTCPTLVLRRPGPHPAGFPGPRDARRHPSRPGPTARCGERRTWMGRPAGGMARDVA